ncbi:MAG: GNAT family N-acetyltransferase [Nocardioidaceae bacterium]
MAAANLTDFLGTAADVGVVVHPAHRGRGLGREVGRAATSYAVAHHGIARWRALVTNAPSREAAARLGFEPYCLQLAVRP